MSYYLPFGVQPGEVADPAILTREAQEAQAVAGKMSWWQMRQAAVGLAEDIDLDDVLHFELEDTHAELQTDRATEPVLGLTGSAGLFQIPYNRGLVEVDNTRREWTSIYPELVFYVVSYSYIRERLNVIIPGFSGSPGGEDTVRFQERLRFDDVDMPGTGPFALGLDGKLRGVGYGGRWLATTVMCSTILPAGSHSACMVAGQLGIGRPDNDNGEAAMLPEDIPPYPGVCIGSRNVILVRIAMGGWLEGG